MAKEEAAAADAQTTPSERITRRVAAQRDFWQAARGRRKKRRGLRVVLVVGGLALGASIAGGVTLYAPQLIGRPTPAPTAAATRSAGPPASTSAAAATHGPQALTGPAQALDGATLTVAGQTVRLQGIEAPPVSLVCRTATFEYRCGDVARRVLDSFAGGSPVACLPAGTAGDASSPTVALCRNHRGWDLAALQVEAGWAIIRGAADSSPYRALQARAQANGAGLWPGFATPKQWAQAGGR